MEHDGERDPAGYSGDPPGGSPGVAGAPGLRAGCQNPRRPRRAARLGPNLRGGAGRPPVSGTLPPAAQRPALFSARLGSPKGPGKVRGVRPKNLGPSQAKGPSQTKSPSRGLEPPRKIPPELPGSGGGGVGFWALGARPSPGGSFVGPGLEARGPRCSGRTPLICLSFSYPGGLALQEFSSFQAPARGDPQDFWALCQGPTLLGR